MQMSPNTWIIIAVIAIIVIIIVALLIAGISMRRSPKIEVIAPQPTRVVQFQQPTAQVMPTNVVQYQPTIRVPQYVELVGQDHPGDDILYRPDLADNIPALESLCNNTQGCAGFNSGGYLKSVAQPSFPSGYNLYYIQ